MFISKQELNEIRTAIKNLQAAVKAQEKKNKTYDASLKNRQLHEQFEKEQAEKIRNENNSIIDEWLNGASEEQKEV